MKRALIILVMVLIAVNTFNQTSRRPTNSNATSGKTETRSTAPRSTSVNTQNTPTRQSSANSEATRTRSTNATERTSSASQNPTGGARTNQNPSGNTPRTNDNGAVRPSNNQSGNNASRTNSNGTTARPSNNTPANNAPRTYNNSSNPSREAHVNNNNQSAQPRYYNNVNERPAVHAQYPSSRVYHGQHHSTHYYHVNYRPEEKHYREVHYIYREPVHYDIYWTREMHHHYIEMYPSIQWHYETGYRIGTISAYRADLYVGEVMNVYGQVSDVFYTPESDEYFLYIGPYYPYQDFTVVIPGWVARNYSYRPENYFFNQHISVTGLITAYEGIPEIVVKRNFQVNVY